MDLISVIIPVYNGEKYLNECIKSVVDQTYKSIEIIIVDDGSTDSSRELVSEWCKKDFRIVSFNQNNGGVSSARNKGLELATGEYITFVDCDDTIEKNMYEILIEAFDTDIDVVHCCYNKIPLKGDKYLVSGSLGDLYQTGIEAVDYMLRGKGFTGSPCTKIYKRSILEGLKFDERLAINEDVLFNYCSLRRANKVYFKEMGLYNYHERKESSCKTTNAIKCLEDCKSVAKTIYSNEKGKKLELLARNRYYMALTSLYRGYIFNNMNTNACEKEIEEIMQEGISVSKKYKNNYIIMKKMPRIYRGMYKVYNKLRKPNWDL